MASTDPRIDAYIEKSAEFAKPILVHLRELIHKTCPGVKETVKWAFRILIMEGASCAAWLLLNNTVRLGFGWVRR